MKYSNKKYIMYIYIYIIYDVKINSKRIKRIHKTK